MKTLVFAVHDCKAGFYGSPFVFPSVALAVRAFEDLVKDPRSSVSKHPGDYRLFRIADFDDVEGYLSPVSPVVFIGCGSDFESAPVSVVESAPELQRVSER